MLPPNRHFAVSKDLRLGTGQSVQLVCPRGENPKWYNQIHTYIHTYNLIKTHGSVSCGPRSRRVTPVSILTGRKRNFRTSVALCCLDQTRRFLLWTLPPPSALRIPNLSEIASSVPEICDFKNWLSFFVFFYSSYFSFSFRTLTKTAIKRELHIRSP